MGREGEQSPMSTDDTTHRDEDHRTRDDDTSNEPVQKVADTTLRMMLLFLGVVVLLFAIGQVMGIDVLAMASDALDNEEARWIVVALFALILIAISLRGFGLRN